MSPPPTTRSDPEAGFTLIEALVALALGVAVVVVVLSTLHIATTVRRGRWLRQNRPSRLPAPEPFLRAMRSMGFWCERLRGRFCLTAKRKA